MTCNHDIAYLVRNACTVRPALGTPARSTHQHVVVMKVFSGNAESQMPETCSINTRITRITRKRECTRTIRWRPVDPCNQHVYTLVRSKYMHAAKHVHGLIPNSLEAKHVNTHVKSRYTCRCHHHPKATFHRTRKIGVNVNMCF